MRSAKSFFNGAIARSDLRRYWPVLFLYVGLWLLFLPIPVWNRAAERNPALVNLTELCADTYATAVVLALIFGGIIVWTGFSILRKTVANLTDEADREYLEKMRTTIAENPHPDWIDIHNLKMIQYGSYFYIDCDLTLPWYYNIRQGHAACTELRETIQKGFSDRVLLSIHTDSCDEKHCSHCAVGDCPYRRERFAAPLIYTLRELTETDEDRDE